MGLFDKLAEANNTSKRYYAIILELLSAVENLTKENIKSYFKSKYNEICDDKALDKALAKFDTNIDPRRKYTWYTLTFKQWQKEKLSVSVSKKDTIINICFEDFKNEVKTKFRELLDRIKPNFEKRVFESELTKFEFVLSLPSSVSYPLVRVAGSAMGEVVSERLLSGDPDMISLVTDEIITYLCKKRGLDRVFAMAMRAKQFESFNNNSNEYKSITKDDCYNVVTTSPTYAKQFKELSTPIETTFEKTALKIYESEFVNEVSDLDWKRWAFKNPRFVDAACYYTLIEMAKHFENSDISNLEGSAWVITTFILN